MLVRSRKIAYRYVRMCIGCSVDHYGATRSNRSTGMVTTDTGITVTIGDRTTAPTATTILTTTTPTTMVLESRLMFLSSHLASGNNA